MICPLNFKFMVTFAIVYRLFKIKYILSLFCIMMERKVKNRRKLVKK